MRKLLAMMTVINLPYFTFATTFAVPTPIVAKEVNIVCTFTSSIDKDGYNDLDPTTFTVRIVEDAAGRAVEGYVSNNPSCPYKFISVYDDSAIRFEKCNKPAWLPKGRSTPDGYLEINRYSGGFSQYVEYKDIDSWLMLKGNCKAASKKL